MDARAITVSMLLTLSISAAVADEGKIVRIPTPIGARCINAKTDEITIALRYVKTQKKNGFLTNDNKAGVTVISTLNSDGNPQARHPSVNLVSIRDAPAGQVYLPLEYPIASLLALSSDNGRTFTKNILLELYLDKTRGANTFGQILDQAGSLLSKLPIPANPYTNAVSQVVNFATTTITNQTKDAGGELFASLTLQFNDRDQRDIAQCVRDGFQASGAIAVVGARGTRNVPPLPLDKLSSDYCWRYVADNTFEIQYAPRPAAGCNGLSDVAFKDVPNDYVMLLVSAATVIPGPSALNNVFAETIDGKPNPAAELLVRRKQDLQESKKLCDAMKLDAIYCGVN